MFYSQEYECTWVKSWIYRGFYSNLTGLGGSKGSYGETNELLGEQMEGVTVVEMFAYAISHPV